MAEDRKTIIQSVPNLVGTPQVYFRDREFNNAIYTHGYKIISELAVRCPCSSEGIGAKPDCLNCGGGGFFYIQPRECNALITGINLNTKYKEWSPELIGTISVTVEDNQKDAIAFYNRITLKEDNGIFTESKDIRSVGDEHFIFLTYAPTDISGVYFYVNSTSPLYKLHPSQYRVSPDNKYVLQVLVDNPPASLSVSYRHKLEYHVIDIPHEVRSSRKLDQSGKLIQLKLPLQGIARRTHLILNSKPNYDGGGIINNG